MTTFEKEILDIIKQNDGIKASEIAEELKCNRSSVNALLYGSLSNSCFQKNYKWYYNSNDDSKIDDRAEETDDSNNYLSFLCRYYLNCLSLEQNRGVSALVKPDSLDYCRINSALNDCFINSNISEFIRKASIKHGISLFIGYPVELSEFYSKNNTKYRKISPVFLFPIEFNLGKITVADSPEINIEVLKKYTNHDLNFLAYDVVTLENELGLNDDKADFDIEDLVEKLQAIRQWNWKEKINPNSINNEVDFLSVSDLGIYNSAVVIAAERSPFTIGLESELRELSKMSEESIKGTALYDWIYPERKITNNDDIDLNTEKHLLEVLPLNTEQGEAIQKALNSNITIVTGPPGTGKSQVVTDLLINAAWHNKKALFTSKNNKAVDVVESRVNSLHEKPILFRLGSESIAQRFAEIANGILVTSQNDGSVISYENEKKKYLDLVEDYNRNKSKKDIIIALRNRVDLIERKFEIIRDKAALFFNIVSERDAKVISDASDAYFKAYASSNKDEQNLIIKLFWFALNKKRVKTLTNKREELCELLKPFGFKPDLTGIDSNEIERFHKEIEELIEDISLTCEYKNLLDDLNGLTTLEDIDKILIEYKHNMAEMSKSLWEKYLDIRNVKLSPALRNDTMKYVSAVKLLQDIDLSEYPDLKNQFKKLQVKLAPYLPCWAVTSLSAKGRIPFEAGLFDLVIVDEASQCDIASVLPLLYRAKNAVIIGDSKQLSHICSISAKQDLNLLQKYNIGFEWSYVANSLYDKAVGIASPNNIIKLRDHHRSYGEIINFSNSEFYDGELRIATNYDKLIIPDSMSFGVSWDDIKGVSERPANGGAYNRTEAERIVSMIESLIVDSSFKGSVGVVTPFRAQAEYIRKIIDNSNKIQSYLYSNCNFWVDTVHKFQGDERDVIFFSPVISSGVSVGAITFLKNTGNLFNVAITRARSALFIVGNKSFCSDCGVPYLEHFVKYVEKIEDNINDNEKIIADYGAKYPEITNKDNVSEWEKILYAVLYDNGIKTLPQYQVDKYRLDLALIIGGRKLDIEVDGEYYHSDWNGELCYRDQIRNQRLYEIGWDVKRFWVYQIRDNISWCVEQIKKWIDNE